MRRDKPPALDQEIFGSDHVFYCTCTYPFGPKANARIIGPAWVFGTQLFGRGSPTKKVKNLTMLSVIYLICKLQWSLINHSIYSLYRVLLIILFFSPLILFTHKFTSIYGGSIFIYFLSIKLSFYIVYITSSYNSFL